MAQPDGINSAEAADLYRQAQRVHATDVADRLRAAGYPANTHAIDMLVREARTVAQIRAITSRNVTRLRLKRVEKLRERVCAAEARLQMAGDSGTARGGAAGGDSEDAGLFQGSSGGAANVALRLSMVPVTLASVVGGASYFAKLAYVWIFALLFNRRKCWIPPAKLKIGVDVINGHMSILGGRKGCRFQPESWTYRVAWKPRPPRVSTPKSLSVIWRSAPGLKPCMMGLA